MASTLRFDNWENSNGDLINSFENPAIYRGKNLLYNGAFNVWQRGTSFTSTNSTRIYTADRWIAQNYNAGAAEYSITKELDAPEGFTNSLKVSCSTVESTQNADQQTTLEQLIETQDVYSLKYFESNPDTVTVSFFVKSNTSGTYGLNFKISDNNSSHNSTGTRIYPTSYTINSVDTWEKKTISIPLDSYAGTKSSDNNFGMGMIFSIGAGEARTAVVPEVWRGNPNAFSSDMTEYNFAASTSNYWQITGVQLETGTVANNFDHKSYGVELAECQRYYFRSDSFASSYSSINNYAGIYLTTAKDASSWLWAWSYFPVEMRSAPTAKVSDVDGTIGKITHWTSRAGAHTSNNTPYSVYPNKNSVTVSDYVTSGIYGFNYHLEADAEL